MKEKKALIFLLIIPLLIIFSWFREGGIHGGGEQGLPFYNAEISSKIYSSLWREISGGYSNTIEISQVALFQILKILTLAGLPNFAVQAVLDYLLMAIGVLSVYYLVKATVSSEIKSNLLPFFAALFYLLNPFSLSQIWGRGLYMQYFPFALHPLFLLLYVLAIKRKSLLPLILALLFSFVLAGAFQHITYSVDLWFLIISYSLFYLYCNRTRKDVLLVSSFFGILFVGWILTQGWWIILYFRSTSDAYYANTSAYVRENIGTFLGVSRDFPLPKIIRLLHEGYFFRDTKYGEIYKSIPFQLISWLIPLITVFSLKYFKQSKSLIFFGALFVIGLVVSLGANFPLGYLSTWLFTHMAPLQIFRNPYEKFGLIFSLNYSVLFAAGLLFVSNRIKGVWVAVLILILGIYAWPVWTGRVISGIDQKVGIQPPSYYDDLIRWIKENKSSDESYRLMMLPIASGEGVVYQWGDRLYNGVPPSDYLLDYPSISSNPRLSYFFDYMQAMRKYISQLNIAPAISLLGVKYVVDREDMVMISPGEKKHKGFLLDTIYPPDTTEQKKRKICTKDISVKKADNFVWFSCMLSGDEINWLDVKYLHIRITTDRPSFLEIAIRDSFENRPVWHGRVDPEYSTSASGYEEITIPLNAPSQFVEKTNFSDIRLFEIIARPKDEQNDASKLDLAGVWLDNGRAEKVDEYKFVRKFGQLNLYENINFNTPPHLGILNNLAFVKNFRELFQEASVKRDQVDRLGFLLPEQNMKKDTEKLLSFSEGTVLESIAVSNTKYFMEVNAEGSLKLVLGERFDPNWKVIPDARKKDLDGSFVSNIKLLRKAYLDESDHFVINGYANLWFADEGSKSYAVVFLPQIFRDTGYKAALWIIGALSLFAIVLVAKSRIRVRH